MIVLCNQFQFHLVLKALIGFIVAKTTIDNNILKSNYSKGYSPANNKGSI